MQKRNIAIVLSALFLIIIGVSAFGEEITREFEKKSEIKISTICGNCRIEKGTSDKIIVMIISDLTPADAFVPVFKERGDMLKINEKIEDSSQGDILWELTIPDGTDIDFSSASGGLEISDNSGKFHGSTASGDYDFSNCSGEFDLSTASGNVRMTDCQGDFNVSSASGDCRLNNCQGAFDVSSASGDVRGKGIILDDDSEFSSASGSADVELGKTAEHDLNVGSASGNAMLDYRGNPMTGFIEMTARRRGGRIVSDIKFDKEEEIERNGQNYIRKSATLKDNSPAITVGTATGTAKLRK